MDLQVHHSAQDIAHTSHYLKFLENIDIQGVEDCWQWKTAKANIHMTTTFLGQSCSAHRLSYRLFKGPLEPGQVVRHTCDNPCCVNPYHLLAGTHKDNTADMIARGRAWWQHQNPSKRQAKKQKIYTMYENLTEVDKASIQKALQKGYATQTSLLRAYNISITTLKKCRLDAIT